MNNLFINQFVQKKVEILEAKKLTSDVVELTLAKPQELNHVPGQFVGIKIEDGQPGIWYRAYSLLQDKSGNLQICVKIVENGRGSNFLFNRQKSDILEIIYPLGFFGFPEKLNSHLVFIATGTGIVPILSMLESFPSNTNYQMDLFFGLRYLRDIFYQKRIQDLNKIIPHFSYLFTLTRPEGEWSGKIGRVTQYLKDIDPQAQYFICGSGAMISEVRKILETQGVPNENIFFEDFNE